MNKTSNDSQLSAAKTALLRKRMGRDTDDESNSEATIFKMPYDQVVPLSSGQMRLWYLHQLEPNLTTFNIPVIYRLMGILNLENLERSIEELLKRHEILRTRIIVEDDTPMQFIDAGLKLKIDQIDLQSTPEPERKIKTSEYINRLSSTTFNLSLAPLWRITLIKESSHQHVLCLIFCHAIFDGGSIQIFIRELSELYNSYNNKKEANIFDAPLQYADFCIWQKKESGKKDFLSQLDYWCNLLSGSLPILELPCDHQRPSQQSLAGAGLKFGLDKALVSRLLKLGRTENATLYMVLLSAYALLLFKFSRQKDFIIGTPIAGRPASEFENVIGYFANTLPLRIKIDSQISIREFLQHIQRLCVGAFSNQSTPLEHIVAKLQPPRDPSRTLLYQTLFSFNHKQQQIKPWNELDLEPLYPEISSSQTDISLWIEQHDSGISVLFEYCTAIFEQATVQHLFDHFLLLLENMLLDPDRPIYTLAANTDYEIERFKSWNRPRSKVFNNSSFLEYLSAHGSAEIKQPAVICDDDHQTYADLEQRSNQLAHHLETLEVKPGDLVGICLDRSAEMLVGLLGIWKAGAAYVPLDPEYPTERLRYMLETAAVDVLLTETALFAIAPDYHCKRVCLDRDQAIIAAQPITPPAISVADTDIAYVIFTSGSTGKPKGVQVPHGAVTNFLFSMAERPGLTPRDRLLAVTTLSFDIAVLELFLPLLVGATVVIASREAAADGGQLLALIEQHNINAMQATPSTWRMLLGSGWQGDQDFKALCGGEALPRDLAIELLPKVGELWNMFGPTETTVWSTCYQITDAEAPLLIGTPIANTQCHVLDEYLQPVPIGVPGELYIGGAGVTAGYLQQDELTAERFIADPFNDKPGARLYRTGDLVRWRHNGQLEYFNRIDNQVKVRGFRIELGEIEAALSSHDQVRECTVIVREDRPGDQRLVAYVVSDSSELNTQTVRQYLGARLPNYMIPQHLVTLDQLPLTPNGKIDRETLQLEGFIKPDDVQDTIAPRNELEAQISEIWSDILGISHFGVTDDFFALGGHSLLATQLLAQINNKLKANIKLKQLFEDPSVAGIAHQIQQLEAHNLTPSLKKMERPGIIPLSSMQSRLWYLNKLESDATAYNVSLACKIEGSLNETLLSKALQLITDRHEILRTGLCDDQGVPYQKILPLLKAPFRCMDIQGASTEEQDEALKNALRAQALINFDLANPPLWRAFLLRTTSGHDYLSLVFHHAIIDGWSIDIFLQELRDIVYALHTGNTINLPHIDFQYADYTLLQNEQLHTKNMAKQVDYWLNELGDNLPTLDLPTDFPRPQHQSFRGASQSLQLDASLVTQLSAIGRRQKTTLFMVLLSAFYILLMRFSGQNRLIVGIPVAGRTRLEYKNTIGFMANTLALPLTINKKQIFTELLDQVRGKCLKGFDHQEAPFEEIVSRLQVRRDLSRTPIYQTMFSFQNKAANQHDTKELTLTPIDTPIERARTDLSFWLDEQSDGVSVLTDYCVDLFSHGTIQQLLSGYRSILKHIVSIPETAAIGMIPITDQGAMHNLQNWNKTEVNYSRLLHLAQQIIQLGTMQPTQTAIICDRHTLTYTELEHRSNQLAHHLETLEVKPGDLVGICLDRSAEMLVGLLGIWKAGAAYVPLDPEYPTERLRYMLETAAVDVLLTETALFAIAPDYHCKRVCLDRDQAIIAAQPITPPAISVADTDIAYVIFTSGSTGKPKGVQVPHGAVTNFLFSMAERPGLTPRDRLLAVTTLSFDIAVLELFLPLLVGATVVIASREAAADGGQLLALIEQHNINAMQATPSTWRMLLGSGWQGDQDFKALCGGEALPRDLAIELLPKVGELWNMFGPTETTVWSTCYQITDAEAPLLIGTPIANTQCHVLDEYLQPVPIGVPGELYIGGAGVTAGYLQQDELTAERFIADPFNDKPGARLYRTGDLVRWRHNGQLEYFNRIDNQVKVRGFRIELGEIEAALSSHDQVRECTVIVREDRPGDQRLVAYVVSDSSELNTQAVRQYLGASLPNYMIPQHLVTLDQLPLTPNGKIDKTNLPKPEKQGPVKHQDCELTTEAERYLAKLWAELLADDEPIYKDDNFFDIGGHSLLAAQLAAYIKRERNIEIPLIAFISNTLEQLSRSYLNEAPDRDSNGPADKNIFNSVKKIFRSFKSG